MNDALHNVPERPSVSAGWPDEAGTRLPLWLTPSEAETLVTLCIGGSVPALQEGEMMARLNELLRAFLR